MHKINYPGKDWGQSVAAKLGSRGAEIFIRPSVSYTWKDIILGCSIPGKAKSQRAVAANTWRRLHRKDRNDPKCLGPSKIFIPYFLDNKIKLLDKITTVKGQEDYHSALNDIRLDLLPELRHHIKQGVLLSYNSVRKPIDLYMEHLVAMAKDLSSYRDKLVPLLYLPLDKDIMGRPECFSEEELWRNGIRRGDGYTYVRTEASYLDLQSSLAHRCARLSKMAGNIVYPIYLDLLWNQRLTKPGSSLFEINP